MNAEAPTVVTFFRVMVLRPTHPSNADAPMVFVVSANVSITRTLQSLNADAPIDSKAVDFDRSTVVSFSQPSNAETPMVLRPVGNVNEAKALHPLNVESAMAVTLDGRVNEVIPSQDLNADTPI